MKNSIRKIASLCLAMMMVLSVMAVPALAEERVVHVCEYDSIVNEVEEPCYHNNLYHRVDVVSTLICECGSTTTDYSSYYEEHIPRGSGTDPQYTFDGEGNVIVTLYTYTCRICDHEYVSE